MKRVIAGPNAVTEAIRGAARDVVAVYLADGLARAAAERLERLSRDRDIPCSTLPRDALDTLAKGLTHQGVIALAGDYPYVDLEAVLDEGRRGAEPLLVVLDQIQDPGNLGAIVRSAHALGATGLILTRDRSASMTPAAVRASAGASELVRAARVGNLAQCLDRLRDSGYRVLGAAAEASAAVDEIDWSGPAALVLGGEGKGLRRLTREHCDSLFRIPLATSFDSLNVSVAAAIALYEIGRARARRR
jgi:23S rRNA (guanosine2251-2'-O)-methyltransferase